jgi:hypothetical protein
MNCLIAGNDFRNPSRVPCRELRLSLRVELNRAYVPNIYSSRRESRERWIPKDRQMGVLCLQISRQIDVRSPVLLTHKRTVAVLARNIRLLRKPLMDRHRVNPCLDFSTSFAEVLPDLHGRAGHVAWAGHGEKPYQTRQTSMRIMYIMSNTGHGVVKPEVPHTPHSAAVPRRRCHPPQALTCRGVPVVPLPPVLPDPRQ